MLTNSLAELEAIPGALKEKLGRLSESQTMADLEALEAEAALTARAAERQAEESLLAQFMPEEIPPEERRAMAPLNGDQGFSLLK